LNDAAIARCVPLAVASEVHAVAYVDCTWETTALKIRPRGDGRRKRKDDEWKSGDHCFCRDCSIKNYVDVVVW
jgi:hypothetical protein